MSESVEIFAGNSLEAGFIQSLLDNAGIKSWLKDEILGTLNPWVVSAGGAGAVKVMVSSLDFQEAKSILENFKKS